MKLVQMLLVIIALELAVIAVKMPMGGAAAQTRGATPVCITNGSSSCLGAIDGSIINPFYVKVR
jgi:hypothetical protein